MGVARERVCRKVWHLRACCSAVDKDVENACRHIADRILTLRCPKCDIAVYDVDSCLLPQCYNCRTYFCGWCFQHPGEDIQKVGRHMSTCANRQNDDKYGGGTLEEFEKANRARRREQLVQYLATLRGEVQRKAVTAMRVNICDLGLQNVIDRFGEARKLYADTLSNRKRAAANAAPWLNAEDHERARVKDARERRAQRHRGA